MTPGAVAALLREGAEELQAEDAQPVYEDARVEVVPGLAPEERAPGPPLLPGEPEPPPSPERPNNDNGYQEMDADTEIANDPEHEMEDETGQFANEGDQIEDNADQIEDNADQFENDAGQIVNDADQVNENDHQETDENETEGVHLLEAKPTLKSKKGRELNDKRFDDSERKQFRDADVANWENICDLELLKWFHLRRRPRSYEVIDKLFFQLPLVLFAPTEQHQEKAFKQRVAWLFQVTF